jgi:HEPN domain-containing protein
MPNFVYASEWIELADRNLGTAKLLFRENHFTDVISIEIHQALEKVLKSVLAYNGIKIIKSHSILELVNQCSIYISLDDVDIDNLIEINDYYENTRYPGPKYSNPSFEEISKNLQLVSNIINRIKTYIKKS